MNCVMGPPHLAGLQWSGRALLLSATNHLFLGTLVWVGFCGRGRSSLGQHAGQSRQSQAEHKCRGTVHGYLLIGSVANIKKRCQINAVGRINPVRLSPLSCEKLTLLTQAEPYA